MRIDVLVRAGEDQACLDAVRNAVERWRAAGHDVRPHATFEAADTARFARRARRADLLVVAGGDGTLNQVVAGLMGGGARPRMAIVPTGTANDFATGLGLPGEDVEECLRLATEGCAVPIDIARVNGRAFINASVGGLGATATRGASADTKKLLGPLAYVLRGAREVAEATAERGRFEADGVEVYHGDFLFFAVGNGRLTGGGTVIAPAADAGDGRVDLVVLKSLPKLELMRLLPAIRAGEHEDHPEVLYIQAADVSVDLESAIPVNVDGEPVDARHLQYDARGGRLYVMAPLVPSDDGA